MAVETCTENYHNIKVLNSNDEVDFLSELDLSTSIRKICEKEGFITYNVDKRCVSTDGGNYLGILYEIDIKGKTKNGNKTLNLFVKHAIDGESIKFMSISDMYNKEIFVYKELSKIFKQLQDEANVPLEERLKMIHIYDESNTKALIMDNIAKKGFTTHYRMKVPSLKFFELSVKQLAKFHGIAFALKELWPEYFSEKIKSLLKPYEFNDDWTEVIRNLKKSTIQHVDDEFKNTLEKSYDIVLEKYPQYYCDEKLKVVLSHGDYRNCNMMIKTNEGEIEELLPVDYQLMHYGNPVFDFLYLIFIGTDRQFRKANLLNLKELYYETLTSFLKYFDLDTNVVYTRQDFEKVYKEKLDYGLMAALIILPFAFASENNVPDLTEKVKCYYLDDKIKERLHELLEEFTELGFL